MDIWVDGLPSGLSTNVRGHTFMEPRAEVPRIINSASTLSSKLNGEQCSTL